MKTVEIIEFLLFLTGSILYIVYIYKNKKFNPNVIAFGIWLVADIIHLATYQAFSVFLIVPIIMVLCAGTIFTISIIRSKKKSIKLMFNELDWIDWTSIGIVIVSIIIWIYSQNPILTNLSIQIALAMGFIPIIKSLIVKQGHEPMNFWLIFLTGFIVLLIHTAFEYTQWEELIYPIIGVIGEFIVVIIIKYNNTKRHFAENAI